MPDLLTAIPWEDDMAAAVAEFSFGEEPWELEMDQWIKVDVLPTIHKFGTEVWLFVNEANALVGFGSLGATNWHWPSPSDRRTRVNLIPALGIDIRFRGQPVGGPRRYSDQIMDHLIREATKHPDRAPVLGLFVHPDNHGARKVYERAGFRPWPQTARGWDNVEYPGMILRLPGRG